MTATQLLRSERQRHHQRKMQSWQA